MAEAEAGLELPIGLTEQKFVQQLARIEARAIKAAKSAEQGFVRGNQAVANSFSRMSGAARGNLQNVSYQLQDIFVQISSGQDAARALGQQMPQLLSGFGALGAVLGLVASAAIPLAANFFATEDAAKALGDSIKSLNAAVDEYNRAAKDADASAAELVSRFGSVTAQAQDLYDRIARLKYIDAVDAVGAAITGDTSCIRVDSHQRTSVPGLYAAGDVVLGLDQISHAMGEGGVAATTIRNDLAKERPILREKLRGNSIR